MAWCWTEDKPLMTKCFNTIRHDLVSLSWCHKIAFISVFYYFRDLLLVQLHLPSRQRSKSAYFCCSVGEWLIWFTHMYKDGTSLEKSWNLNHALKSHWIWWWSGKMAFYHHGALIIVTTFYLEKSLKIMKSHWKYQFEEVEYFSI